MRAKGWKVQSESEREKRKRKAEPTWMVAWVLIFSQINFQKSQLSFYHCISISWNDHLSLQQHYVADQRIVGWMKTKQNLCACYDKIERFIIPTVEILANSLDINWKGMTNSDIRVWYLQKRQRKRKRENRKSNKLIRFGRILNKQIKQEIVTIF